MTRWRSWFWGRPRGGGAGGALGELIDALQPTRAVTVAELAAQREGVPGDHRQDADGPRLIDARDDPPWLPPGSRAEIWASSAAPRPTGLVRLALRRDDAVFCAPREDGRLDLPTRAVAPDDPDGHGAARALARDILGEPGALTGPIGFVRNVVPDPDAGYPWPVPLAHFTLWAATGGPAVPGEWLPLAVDSPLRDQHWFPLLAS
ncbi:NUDIX hydrolase [Cellulomonas denverensis]|uniref:NUDIX hydrolase n=1 Tax=Cellulomonas denverensis TaxID=264297 RepID=UPI001A560783|nr:NUDIX hydrolase [Cellulomonas denverensis]GIG26383.1 hypothetical protein Cde04nite_26270 [Cellulomonas denverensis]